MKHKLVASILFAILATVARAQTTQTVTVSSTVPQVLAMTVDTNAVSIPFLGTDYNVSTGLATKTAASATTFSVSSNKGWTVSVKANTAAFAFTASAGDPDPIKAAGSLSYKVSTAGTSPPLRRRTRR